MTGPNYVKHFTVLGKLAYLYDHAGAEVTAQEALMAVFMDEIATGAAASLPTVELFAARLAQWRAVITGGGTNGQALARTLAEAYLVSAIFVDTLTTTISGAVTALKVLEALQTEMGAGVDNKTLTTLAATGLVHFFNTWSPTGSWNTEANETADYQDSVYVVATAV